MFYVDALLVNLGWEMMDGLSSRLRRNIVSGEAVGPTEARTVYCGISMLRDA